MSLYEFSDGNGVHLDPEFEKFVVARLQEGTSGASYDKRRQWLRHVIRALHRSGYEIIPVSPGVYAATKEMIERYGETLRLLAEDGD